MLFNIAILHHPLCCVKTTQETPTTPFYLLIICSITSLWCSLLFPFTYWLNTFHSSLTHFLTPFPPLSFGFSSHWQLPQPLFAMQQALSFPLSHNLLVAHSQRLTPLFIDRGKRGSRGGGCVWGLRGGWAVFPWRIFKAIALQFFIHHPWKTYCGVIGHDERITQPSWNMDSLWAWK